MIYTYRLFMGRTLTATRTDAIAHPSYWLSQMKMFWVSSLVEEVVS